MEPAATRKPRRSWPGRLALSIWLTVLILLIVVWIRSFWVYDRVHFLSERFSIEQAGSTLLAIRSGNGRFIYDYNSTWVRHVEAYRVVLSKGNPAMGSKRKWGRVSVPVGTDVLFDYTFRRSSAFSWEGESQGSAAAGARQSNYSIGAPYGVIILPLLLPLPIWWILHIRKKQIAYERRRLGRCIACGYDLRATPERCPECGWTSVPAPP